MKNSLPATTRSQFITNKEEIYNLIDKGYSKKDVWRHMVSEGKIEMSYQSFLNHLQAPDPKRPFSRKKLPPLSTTVKSPTTTSEEKPEDSSPRGFNHDNTPYLNPPTSKEEK